MPITDKAKAKAWQKHYQAEHARQGLCKTCTEPIFRAKLCEFHYGYRRGVQDKHNRKKLMERGGKPRGHYRKHGLYGETQGLLQEADVLLQRALRDMREAHARLVADLHEAMAVAERIPKLQKEVAAIEQAQAMILERAENQEPTVPWVIPDEIVPTVVVVHEPAVQLEAPVIADDIPHCPKCQRGLLNLEMCYDNMEAGEPFPLLKCVNCGWRGDAVMEANKIKTTAEKEAELPRRGRKPRTHVSHPD